MFRCIFMRFFFLDDRDMRLFKKGIDELEMRFL